MTIYLKHFIVGHYLYTEASSGKPNDTARLISPMVHIKVTSCLHVAYHMYGTEIGTLNIQYQPSGYNVQPLWKLQGNQGYSWELLSVEIPSQESQIQIIVEGIRGHGHRGDMAIDDVTLIPGPCDKKGKVVYVDLFFNHFTSGLHVWSGNFMNTYISYVVRNC